tara:strand:+ start:158 stop:616 length:459 start_codon:yes stop_codon:yes gene_type:complete
MRHFLFLFLSIVILTPLSSYAQQELKKDGSYLWKDASNSMLREALNFATDELGDNFVAISSQGNFETVSYNAIDGKIVFIIKNKDETEKKYTCNLQNNILLVKISQTGSTDVVTRTYTFMAEVNAAPPAVPELIPMEIEEDEEEEELELEPG